MEYLSKFGLVFGLSFLVACAVSETHKIPVDPPIEWISQFNTDQGQCVDVDARFFNNGERYLGNGMIAQDGLFAEMVFSQYLPSGLGPEYVEFSSDVQSGQVEVTLVGESTQRMEFEIFCEFGWTVLRSSRNGEYLGAGVVEKQFERVAFFRLGNKGELIVRVLLSASFNSMYVFNSEVESEGWYRFQPVLP